MPVVAVQDIGGRSSSVRPVEGDEVMLMCVNPFDTAKRSVIRRLSATSGSLFSRVNASGDENTGVQATASMERTTSKQAKHLIWSIPMVLGAGRSL